MILIWSFSRLLLFWLLTILFTDPVTQSMVCENSYSYKGFYKSQNMQLRFSQIGWTLIKLFRPMNHKTCIPAINSTDQLFLSQVQVYCILPHLDREVLWSLYELPAAVISYLACAPLQISQGLYIKLNFLSFLFLSWQSVSVVRRRFLPVYPYLYSLLAWDCCLAWCCLLLCCLWHSSHHMYKLLCILLQKWYIENITHTSQQSAKKPLGVQSEYSQAVPYQPSTK